MKPAILRKIVKKLLLIVMASAGPTLTGGQAGLAVRAAACLRRADDRHASSESDHMIADSPQTSSFTATVIDVDGIPVPNVQLRFDLSSPSLGSVSPRAEPRQWTGYRRLDGWL